MVSNNESEAISLKAVSDMNTTATTLTPFALFAGFFLFTTSSVFADRVANNERYQNQVGATLRLIELGKIAIASPAETYRQNLHRGIFARQSDEAWMQMMQGSGLERTLVENILHGQPLRNSDILTKHPRREFLNKAIQVAEWGDWKDRIQRSAARYKSFSKSERLELIRGDLEEMALNQYQREYKEVHRYYSDKAGWLKRNGGSRTVEPDSNIETAILNAMTVKDKAQEQKNNPSTSEAEKVLLRFVGNWRVEEVLVYSDTHQRLLSKQKLSVTKSDLPLRINYSRRVGQLIYSDDIGELTLSVGSKITTKPSSLLKTNGSWVRQWRVFLEQNKQDFGDAYMTYDNSAKEYIFRDFFKNGPREFVFTWDATTQRMMGSNEACSIHFIDADNWVFTEHMEQRKRNRTRTVKRVEP